MWQAFDAAEKRKDAKTEREFLVSLPHELGPETRRELVAGFAQELVDRFGLVADCAIHEPSRHGDQRNWHAHILTTTRRCGPAGPGEKIRELDRKQTSGVLVEQVRASWAERCNATLEQARSMSNLGIDQVARLDHRSYRRQGIDRVPGRHLGPAAAAKDRKAGRPISLTGVYNAMVAARNMAVSFREKLSVLKARMMAPEQQFDRGR